MKSVKMQQSLEPNRANVKQRDGIHWSDIGSLMAKAKLCESSIIDMCFTESLGRAFLLRMEVFYVSVTAQLQVTSLLPDCVLSSSRLFLTPLVETHYHVLPDSRIDFPIGP